MQYVLALLLAAPVVFVQTTSRLEIVPIANAGVLLRCGADAMLVDALFREGVAGYETVAAAQRDALETGAGPFAGVRLILATHGHRDHFDPQAVARHLERNPRAEFWGTRETAGSVRILHPLRVREIGRHAARAFEGGRVTFFPVPHNAPHRTTVEHSALLVEFCGQGVFFSGDAELEPVDFGTVREARPRIDVAVVPWWFLTARAGRTIVDTILQPAALWAVHGDLRDREAWIAQVRSNYPDARIP
jgi:L-ascorbate metabolism protein UlaG (beta-lactamase superfamily)